jgi:hypothetical protein
MSQGSLSNASDREGTEHYHRNQVLANGVNLVVAGMMDGAKPQPPQTFKRADFLERVQKQKALAVPPGRGCQAYGMVRKASDLWQQPRKLSGHPARRLFS